MKRFFWLIVALSLVLSACAQEKAVSGSEAIEIAKAMETMQQKAAYLIQQANAFYNSQEFQQAVDVAHYILRYVDEDSQEAKDLLTKAKDALTAAAKGAVADATKKLPGFGQ